MGRKVFREIRNHQEKEVSSVGYHEPIKELSDDTRAVRRRFIAVSTNALIRRYRRLRNART